MGLLDMFGGGDGDQTPETPEAAAQRQRLGQGLLGLAAGMLSQGYSRLPVGFGQSVGLGLQGMLGAMQGYDSNLKTRAETGLIGEQTGKTKAETNVLKQRQDLIAQLLGGGTAPAGSSSPAAPGGTPTAGAPDTIVDPNSPFALIKHYESGGNYNIGYGGTDLSNAPRRADGFPIWEGKDNSHAAGAYQFQPDTWAQYAKPLGIKDFSPESQDAVARAAYLDKGFGHWAPYNKALAAAIPAWQASQQKPPVQLASASGPPSGLLAAAGGAPPGGADAVLAREAAANAAARQAQGLPPMTPAGLAAQGPPPVQPGMPPPGPVQGPLAQPGPQMPPGASGAPAGPPGLLAQAGQPQQSPPPQAGGMQPGGGMNLLALLQNMPPEVRAGIMGDLLGIPSMGQMLTGTPSYKGAVAGAEAQAQQPYKPLDIRQGGAAFTFNPQTGKYEIAAQVPKLPEGYSLSNAPGGGPMAVEVPGAMAGFGRASEHTAAGTERGKASVQYGDLLNPPTAPPFPMGTPMGAPAASGQQGAATGKPTVPLSEQYIPQNPAQLKDALPEWQKRVDDWANSIEPARQAELRLQSIAQAYKMTEAGSFATDKAALAGALKSLGIPFNPTSTDPAAVQLALHENYLQTLVRLKAANSRFTGQEFRVTSENAEHPNIQPAANLEMLSQDIAIVRQAQKLAGDWNSDQQHGWKNPVSYETAWTQRNPLSAEAEAVKKEIGPLKGMGPQKHPEGTIVTNPQGQTLKNQGGQWIDQKTLKPYVPPTR